LNQKEEKTFGDQELGAAQEHPRLFWVHEKGPKEEEGKKGRKKTGKGKEFLRAVFFQARVVNEEGKKEGNKIQNRDDHHVRCCWKGEVHKNHAKK